jgi:uncharacterized membrane protein YvbJ
MWKLAAVLDDPRARPAWSEFSNQPPPDNSERKDVPMRSILLWALGVPIPIIILIALFYR